MRPRCARRTERFARSAPPRGTCRTIRGSMLGPTVERSTRALSNHLRRLDTSGTGRWTDYGGRDSLGRGYGSRAMYDIGKLLVAGGGPSSPTATVINMNGTTPTATATAPMQTGRRQHNLTVLADGTVLATGGNSSGEPLVDMENGVYPAELWDPATGQWQTLAPMQVTRQYHSSALLLPDGRVLSAGGGICGTCTDVGYMAKNAEVFTPPYLFKDDGSGELAPRPAITSAPGVVGHGAQFSVGTPEAGSIAKAAMVRLGAVTHSVNMEQRYVPLSSTAGSGSIRRLLRRTRTSPHRASHAVPHRSTACPPCRGCADRRRCDSAPSATAAGDRRSTTPIPTRRPGRTAPESGHVERKWDREDLWRCHVHGPSGSGPAATFNRTGFLATAPSNQTTQSGPGRRHLRHDLAVLGRAPIHRGLDPADTASPSARLRPRRIGRLFAFTSTEPGSDVPVQDRRRPVRGVH